MIIEQISLYYKDGGSDKVYQAQIEESNGAYIVNFQYGKRNSTLSTGCKTANPVELPDAKKIYDKLIKEKKAKGYAEGESGAVFQSQSFEDRVTGIYPQLPNTLKGDEEVLVGYFDNDEWVLQEKFDGRRLITQKIGNKVTAINKKGLSILMPQSIEDKLNTMKEDAVFDGEIIGENYYIYDIMEFDGKNLREEPVSKRLEKLYSLPIADIVAKTSYTPEQKKATFIKLKETKKEGIVLKKRNSQYIPGKPASGGNQLKFRFFETSTFHVTKHSKKARSIEVSVYDENGKQYILGKVSVPVNWEMPEIGSFVEVKYAHCFVDGALYHSVYLGPRDDQDISNCTLSQIKFKPVDDEEEEELVMVN
jgi:bifunctional non-homologous end joining protein LigD